MNAVPARGYKARPGGNWKDGSSSHLRKLMLGLQVGESVIGPHKWESPCRVIARRIGIKVVSRREGRDDFVTVYRVA